MLVGCNRLFLTTYLEVKFKISMFIPIFLIQIRYLFSQYSIIFIKNSCKGLIKIWWGGFLMHQDFIPMGICDMQYHISIVTRAVYGLLWWHHEECIFSFDTIKSEFFCKLFSGMAQPHNNMYANLFLSIGSFDWSCRKKNRW